jgi:hypothetical protein
MHACDDRRRIFFYVRFALTLLAFPARPAPLAGCRTPAAMAAGGAGLLLLRG